MATCGNCKTRDVDVAHVRGCYGSTTIERKVVRVPRVKVPALSVADRLADVALSTGVAVDGFVSDVDEEELDWRSGDDGDELAELVAERALVDSRTVGVVGRKLFDVAQDEREEGWGELTLEAEVDSTWQIADVRTRYNQRVWDEVENEDERTYHPKRYSPVRVARNRRWEQELWHAGTLCAVHNVEHRDCGC